jgi:regulator of cell morphogenesis and NO signaling
MKISQDTIVGDVVKFNFKTASLFQANKIDYCCGGNKPISEACLEVGANPDQLIKQLELLASQTDPDSEYINNLELNVLADYIIKRHHRYVRENIPTLQKGLEKLCRVHGDNHPELFKVKELFDGCAQAMTAHMQKEEILLFPYIVRLVEAKKAHTPLPQPPFGSVANPIGAMMAEHENEGERFMEISRLTNSYILPDGGCTTYDVTLKQLKDFQDDLHRHIHLENNILFPKSIEIEKSLH